MLNVENWIFKIVVPDNNKLDENIIELFLTIINAFYYNYNNDISIYDFLKNLLKQQSYLIYNNCLIAFLNNCETNLDKNRHYGFADNFFIVPYSAIDTPVNNSNFTYYEITFLLTIINFDNFFLHKYLYEIFVKNFIQNNWYYYYLWTITDPKKLSKKINANTEYIMHK